MDERKWNKLQDVEESVIVISGGSNGLGHELICQMLQRYSKSLIINIDIAKPSFENERLVYYKCDLSDISQVEDVTEQIRKKYSGRINLLINNAGIRLPFKSLKQLETSELKKIFIINCIAPVELIKKLTPDDKSNQQCYMVTIASILGILNPNKVAAYAATKASLISFHQSYEQELRTHHDSNTRTLLVLPGQLNTNMFSQFNPPRQFLAPVINVGTLAEEILTRCDRGERGTLYTPFYAYFAHLLMSMPYIVQLLARKLSQIDECLPNEISTD